MVRDALYFDEMDVYSPFLLSLFFYSHENHWIKLYIQLNDSLLNLNESHLSTEKVKMVSHSEYYTHKSTADSQ